MRQVKSKKIQESLDIYFFTSTETNDLSSKMSIYE